MTGTRDSLEHLRSAFGAALPFDAASGWSDHELLTNTAALEALGRLVDAHRAAAAGEVAERSRVELGDQRLSTRRGCRSAAELVERVTQASASEVLLCWFHHRTIDTSGWGIRMLRGVPQIRPPAWLDPSGGWRPMTKSPIRLADRRDRRKGSSVQS